jgi:hypothetical protein
MQQDHLPRVQKLLQSGAFAGDHFACHLQCSDPIVPALEHFLSLEATRGFEEKLRDLRTKPRGPKTTNQRRIQWASLCAELGAIHLLGKTLRANIVGFERVSPRARRQNARCDLLAMVHGRRLFIEVKRNAAEDKQVLPELLEENLRERRLPFTVAIELRDRNYDCSDLGLKLADLDRHLESFETQTKVERVGRTRPPSFNAGAFCVSFVKPSVPNSTPQTYFSPVFGDQLKPYLLGPGAPGKNGLPMKPMVEEADEKGADYLFCRVPRWEDWAEIIGKCFADIEERDARTFFSRDTTMLSLSGIVLFSRYDDFCIINNLRMTDRSWLLA